MESAARWWVNMDRRLKPHERTWTNLKRGLLRRYAPRLDLAMAEWRVNSRTMGAGETYADFAAGLREAADRNPVSERVLLAQFLRCLDKTTKQLVKQRPVPRTLEEAVDKASEIDDSMDNVAQGMQNIGQSFPTAQNSHVMTSGHEVLIPGVGRVKLPSVTTQGAAKGEDADGMDEEQVTLFSNPQGERNPYTGRNEVPKGRVWNGWYWAEAKKGERKKQRATPKKDAKKPRRKREQSQSSDDEPEEKPAPRKLKAAVKQVVTERVKDVQRTGTETAGRVSIPDNACRRCGKVGHFIMQCPEAPKCFACNKLGHYARDCTDPDAKARNDAYMQQREKRTKPAPEN
ncbi:hypothetical protein F444_09880 [Phytophthora nicotianae P1976]|uniref:CCHC-type domain-containing protein n=1 Tax=Phytophthora nicotianae P1976 TaxID=1317066 RepID=A0A081A654_PHYNI|nr:hypothetical protein F444_09880 [Phytophthora nicotianae P1976]